MISFCALDHRSLPPLDVLRLPCSLCSDIPAFLEARIHSPADPCFVVAPTLSLPSRLVSSRFILPEPPTTPGEPEEPPNRLEPPRSPTPSDLPRKPRLLPLTFPSLCPPTSFLSSSFSFFFPLRLPTMSSPDPPVQTLLEQTVTLLGTAASWVRLPAIASTVRHTASLTLTTP